MVHGDLPVLTFHTVTSWRDWLVTESALSGGAWLRISKKGAAEPTISYQQALDTALCFGWIDGQKAPLDEHYWLQRFTPRRPGSKWSKVNKGKAEALIEAGMMQPPGLREIERAKSDGRWDAAYAGRRDSVVPDDLRQALDASPAASEFFEKIDGLNRFAIIYRIGAVKRPETRARKIAQYVQMLAEHKKVIP